MYATDTEGYVGTDKRLVKFAKDADVLIHDAQYLDEHYWGQLEGFPSTQGFGHSTVTMACEVAASSQTGQLILFHHDPSYADDVLTGMERKAKSLFADTTMAYEGLEIDISPRFDCAARKTCATPLPFGHDVSAKKTDVQYAQNG